LTRFFFSTCACGVEYPENNSESNMKFVRQCRTHNTPEEALAFNQSLSKKSPEDRDKEKKKDKYKEKKKEK